MNKNVASCVSVLQVAIPTPKTLSVKRKDKEGNIKYRRASANFLSKHKTRTEKRLTQEPKRTLKLEHECGLMCFGASGREAHNRGA